MTNNKQTREQLGVKAGDQIIIKGRVAFARLDKPVSGQALKKENERRAKLGMLPTKEFRSLTIEDPTVVQGEGTPLAAFYGQKVYQNTANQKMTMAFESKSLYPPKYGHKKDGVIVEMPDPERNPAPGQVVYIMINAYAPKGFSNLGSSFDAIVFEEGEIKFYEGNNGLAGFGQAMNMAVAPLPAAVGQNNPQMGSGGMNPPNHNGFNQASQHNFNQESQGGFHQAPTGSYEQPQNGGFGGAPTGDPNQFNQQNQANQFNQSNQGNFGQSNQFGQPNQGGFDQANQFNGNEQVNQKDNPFGVQDRDLAVNGNPFGSGAGNSQRGSNPFA